MTDAECFARARPRLLRLAYSELGDVGEAEDVVQEAWLRLERADAHAIENLDGWLTTVVARLGDRAWLRGVGWLYPPLMLAVTVATGNHLLVDAAASVLVVAVALVLARCPWATRGRSAPVRRAAASPDCGSRRCA